MTEEGRDAFHKASNCSPEWIFHLMVPFPNKHHHLNYPPAVPLDLGGMATIKIFWCRVICTFVTWRHCTISSHLALGPSIGAMLASCAVESLRGDARAANFGRQG